MRLRPDSNAEAPVAQAILIFIIIVDCKNLQGKLKSHDTKGKTRSRSVESERNREMADRRGTNNSAGPCRVLEPGALFVVPS